MAQVEPKQFTLKNGENITIRTPFPEEAVEVLEHNKANMKTSLYLLTTEEEFTLTVEQEREFLQQMLESEGKLALVADYHGEVVGFLDFHNGRRKRIQHQGEFGMSVREDFRQLGVGKALMNVLIDWAEAHPLIEKVNLQVFSKNAQAIELYKKFGFVEEGLQQNAIKMEDGSYHDLVMMSCAISRTNNN